MTLDKLKEIQLVILDVDGVLTAGEIIYSDKGEQIKVFNVKDGLGIRMLKAAGIDVGIITGRTGGALKHRCRNLGIDLVFDGIRNKTEILDEIMAQTGIAAEQMAFIGDDLPDLAVMKRVGLAVAVADAHETVRQSAHIVTRLPGGRGAVREICDAILQAQGRWTSIMEKLFHVDH
jgi:3-deoxy-D-manno-octulosonate 8-phosphate phosphatase (KDO 8-P phosphatase)